ncbi:MAG: PrsW family intramembrane metalloprotease [Pyrinomonadaceae bacterium]|nr:PrsW family intramembrane metalloprotease [Pyrinomonadaceae bacterium]
MKLILTINEGSLAGQEFNLSTGHLSIGRTETCSIRFDPLKEKIASSQHAFVEARPDGFYITDNNSTNGTFVNGERVSAACLQTGDSIQFGTNGITASVVVEEVNPTNPDPQATVAYSADTAFDKAEVAQFGQSVQSLDTAADLKVSMASIGLGKLEVEPETSSTGKYIGIGITLLGIMFLGLLVAGIIFLSIGPVAAFIAAIVAFIPAVFYLIPIMWLDRYDPEPFWLLSLAFAWGALLAVFISFIANTLVGVSVAVMTDPQIGGIAGAVLAAPFFEELTKGAGLLMIILVFRKYFDGILDGIIFGAVIALGFATVENVLYYGRALLAGGAQALVIIFFVRGVLSPFAHVTFTAMTGIGFGIARETHNTAVKFIMPIVGLGAAMFLHALWNGMATFLGGGFLLAYLVIEIPLFLIFVGFCAWVMWRQNRILKEMLAIDVARGLIPQEDFEKATSAIKSTIWKISSIFNGKYRATSRYIQAIGKLGLSYWHIQRATAAQGNTASFQQNPILREEVLKWKDQV